MTTFETIGTIRNGRTFPRLVIVVFLPFACGYFLSYLFRTINSLIAKDLMTDLMIGQESLGIMTAAYFFAFAVCQLPLGVMLDRFGPRGIQSLLMAVTAFGALAFSASTGFFGAVLGRTLIGVGLSAALMAAIKANAIWFPRERLGLVNGCTVATGGLGALAATYPADFILQAYGWRGMFVVLAGASAMCSILILLVTPPSPAATHHEKNRGHGLGFVWRNPFFQRIAPLASLSIGAVWSIQGFWAARWLTEVNGFDHGAVLAHLSLMAVGFTAGSFVFGQLNDRIGRHGLSEVTVLASAGAAFICVQVALVAGIALPTYLLWTLFSLFGGLTVLIYSALSVHFPQMYVGRATTCINIVQQFSAFFIQSVIGIVLGMLPRESSGGASATAYQIAFMVPIGLQVFALVWLVFPVSSTKRLARQIVHIGLSWVESTLLDVKNATQNSVQAGLEIQSPLPVMTNGIALSPILSPASSSLFIAAPAAGPDGTLDIPFEVVNGTRVDPGPGLIRLPASEVARAGDDSLLFPTIAPRHVQAINAVYGRRSAFATAIGGRKVTVTAAGTATDRPVVAACRVALWIAGEHGELWLPRALLDFVIAGVDPTLSLDSLAPDQAAVVLEFALGEALEKIEAILGSEIAVVSISRSHESSRPEQLSLSFTVSVEGFGTDNCELRLASGHVIQPARHRDRYPEIDRPNLDLPMEVCLRFAAARLTIGEIERLLCGDVVLIEARCQQPTAEAIAVIGEHLVAPVELTPQGGRLAARPMPGRNSPWAWSMARTTDMLRQRADADGGDLPQHVVFELGRIEIPLASIRQLTPTALLRFPHPLGDELDILVEGRKIGCGTLTAIGDRAGVRVARLSKGVANRLAAHALPDNVVSQAVGLGWSWGARGAGAAGLKHLRVAQAEVF